jgi:tetratricopeptide (TPR) repeat protein
MVVPALLAVATIAAYGNSLSGPFIFDDRGTIIDNTTIEDLGSRDVLSAPRETSVAGRPAANLSFALNFALGGRDVTGYHAVNIAIHVLCALALFGIARRSQPSEAAAFAIALLWALHPLNTETVDYVTQRTESLMALCYLLTLYCAIRAHRAAPRGSRWEAAAIAACALGLCSKESMVTAPLAIVLYDRAFLFGTMRGAVRARWRLYAGLAATWLILAGLMWSSPRGLSAGFSAHDADVRTYLLNQGVMITRYLRLAIWPRDLVLYYGWPLPLEWTAVLPEAGLILGLAAITAFALWRVPRLGVLGVFFFLTLAPTSSLVPIATEVGAERRMYLPLVSIVALSVIGFRWLVQSPRLRVAALAVAAVALGAGTMARNGDYQSSLRLAETTFERWPVASSHSMLGTELAAAGRLAEAERHLREAAPVYPPARYYLGSVLAVQGQRAEAIPQFQSFIASQPPELDQVHLARALLADALVKEGRLDEAAAQYRTMLAGHPDDAQAMVQLAQVLLRQQRFAEASAAFRDAVAARPDDVAALGGLGISLASSGHLDEAITAFRRAVELDPQNEHAQQNLARALALRGLLGVGGWGAGRKPEAVARIEPAGQDCESWQPPETGQGKRGE